MLSFSVFRIGEDHVIGHSYVLLQVYSHFISAYELYPETGGRFCKSSVFIHP